MGTFRKHLYNIKILIERPDYRLRSDEGETATYSDEPPEPQLQKNQIHNLLELIKSNHTFEYNNMESNSTLQFQIPSTTDKRPLKYF